MTTEAHAHAASSAGEHHEHIHERSYYFKTWALLCVLLIISFVGPIVAPHIVDPQSWAKTAIVLTTAFGIAIVKAYYVCARFMHLNIERPLGSMIVLMAVVLLGLFFGGVAPDVMKHQGDHWVNVSAKAETARRIEREGEHGEKLDAEIHAKAHGGHGAAKHEDATHGGAPAPGAAPAHP